MGARFRDPAKALMLSARSRAFVSDPLLGNTVEANTSPLPFSGFAMEFTVDLLA